MRRYLVALTIGIAACGAEITSPTLPGIDDVAVLIGAADIAVCGAGGSMETGRMLDTQPGTVFIAGDIAYTEGTAEQFRACYDPVWGRHKARTRPAPGNHEYGSASAAPYFAYFGSERRSERPGLLPLSQRFVARLFPQQQYRGRRAHGAARMVEARACDPDI